MIRDLRAQRLQLQQVEEAIPGAEDQLENLIKRRASLKAVIAKMEAQDLAKNHPGICGESPDFPLESSMDPYPKCERFYGHTGVHSWEGGGTG